MCFRGCNSVDKTEGERPPRPVDAQGNRISLELRSQQIDADFEQFKKKNKKTEWRTLASTLG